MATEVQFYGRVSLVSGVLALLIGVSPGIFLSYPEEGGDFSRFIAISAAMNLLYHAIPLLSFIAFFAGVPARSHRTSQIGMVAGGLAALPYLLRWMRIF